MLDTLDNVKSRLNISGTTYDIFLTAQINLISDVIEAYCRRTFTLENYTQTFYGGFEGDYRPSRLVELFNWPVTAVASITEDDVVLDPSLYRLHGPSGRIIRPTALANSFGQAFFRADVTAIVYTSGFTTIPSPILSVLDSIILERYTKQTAGINLNFGADVQRVSIPGAISIDFDYSHHNNDRQSDFGVILGSNTNVLDNYRSERAILGNSTLIYLEEN